MITVENEFETQEAKSLTEVEIGTAFIGTVEDIEGEPRTGVFLRTPEGVVYLDEVSVEFDTFESTCDPYYAPKVSNYRCADITVRVDDIE